MQFVLQTCPEPPQHSAADHTRVYAVETREGVRIHNKLATSGEAVGGLFYSTC
jgi:hypothetical protein